MLDRWPCLLALICATSLGCATSSKSRSAQHSPPIVSESRPTVAPPPPPAANLPAPQAISLLGQPLYPPVLPPEVRAQREEQLYQAQADYDRDLHDEDAIIWLGRRQAYLGLYRDAIDTFSNGLAILPESHRLLRHRGHRSITVRQFDDAIADLALAASIIDTREIADEVEPDGQPNERNIPTSTSHSNIFYHLGLAHYLQGDWPKAIAAYERCLIFSTNDDMRIATMYWLYLSMQRAGRDADADMLLLEVTPDMDIIENASYHRLLRVFKGELDARALLPQDGVANDVSIDLATIAYGLAVRDLVQGDADAAARQYLHIIETTNWAAFGHIAAEADLARLRSAGE